MKLRFSLSLIFALICLVTLQIGSAFVASLEPPFRGVTFNPTEFAGPFFYVQCGGPIPETDYNGHPVL